MRARVTLLMTLVVLSKVKIAFDLSIAEELLAIRTRALFEARLGLRMLLQLPAKGLPLILIRTVPWLLVFSFPIWSSLPLGCHAEAHSSMQWSLA